MLARSGDIETPVGLCARGCSSTATGAASSAARASSGRMPAASSSSGTISAPSDSRRSIEGREAGGLESTRSPKRTRCSSTRAIAVDRAVVTVIDSAGDGQVASSTSCSSGQDGLVLVDAGAGPRPRRGRSAGPRRGQQLGVGGAAREVEPQAVRAGADEPAVPRRQPRARGRRGRRCPRARAGHDQPGTTQRLPRGADGRGADTPRSAATLAHRRQPVAGREVAGADGARTRPRSPAGNASASRSGQRLTGDPSIKRADGGREFTRRR